jgi:hypothetical protein
MLAEDIINYSGFGLGADSDSCTIKLPPSFTEVTRFGSVPNYYYYYYDVKIFKLLFDTGFILFLLCPAEIVRMLSLLRMHLILHCLSKQMQTSSHLYHRNFSYKGFQLIFLCLKI